MTEGDKRARRPALELLELFFSQVLPGNDDNKIGVHSMLSLHQARESIERERKIIIFRSIMIASHVRAPLLLASWEAYVNLLKENVIDDARLGPTT